MKYIITLAMLFTLAACSNKQAQSIVSESQEVTFEIAQNYFFKNGQDLPTSPKIATSEDFERMFGMATTMGGKPTVIDFSQQFVIAIILPVTDTATDITPIKLEERGDSLFYTYDIQKGEKQSFSMRPQSIIIVDKKYQDRKIVLVNNKEK